MPSLPKFKNWCFTLNNYTQLEVDALKACGNLVKYMVVGHEVGESGTPHLQGFVTMKNAVRFNSMKQLLGDRAHIEPAREKVEKNFRYCTKDGDFWEVNDRPLFPKQKGQMERQRYEDAWNAAVRGDIEDIDPDIRLRHYHTIKRIRTDAILQQQLQDTEEEMLWYYGESGTGKSRKARTDFPDAYLKCCNKWWDGYVDQTHVIIEDFDKKHEVLIHHLKIWADRYPFPAEIKGSTIKIRPKQLIITSNYHPRDIWTAASDLEPILRRFRILEFRMGEEPREC